MAKFVGNFTEAMMDYTEKKLEKLSSRGIDCTDARVKLEFNSNGCVVEISVANKLRAKKKGASEDYYDIVLKVIDCLISQTERYNRYNDKKASSLENEETYLDEDDIVKSVISKEKNLYVEAMSFENAVEEMEVRGHSFYIYKDIDLNGIMCVLYKRCDGTYGVIHCLQ